MAAPIVPDDYAFLRVGGRTFTVTEVAVPSVDAFMSNMQDVHNRRVAAQTQALRNEFVQEAFSLASREIDDIRAVARSNEVAIPGNRSCLPLVLIGREICPVRSVIYSPNRFTGSLSYWASNMERIGARVREKLGYDPLEIARDATASHQLIITCNSPWQAVTLFSVNSSRMLTTRKGFHTTGALATSNDGSITWHTMCTGNTAHTAYWALPAEQFKAAINSVNLDSMANRSVIIIGTSAVSLEQIIQSAPDFTVQHVRPTENWRV